MPRVVALLFALALPVTAVAEVPASWQREFPKTDFSNRVVPLEEIRSGGPPRDGVPSIDAPRFVPIEDAEGLAGREPVIGLVIDDEARAYPLRILTWHEIVNDQVAGVPVAVTYCPLCNAAIVFDRRLDGRVLEFGTTGRLRHSDLVMYDRQTETWWQQFTGEGIVGELAGRHLEMLPARLESFAEFRERAPDGQVLVPTDRAMRDYGRNPYVGYDDIAARPFLYDGAMPGDVPPMMRVVAVNEVAWTLDLLRREGRIEHGDLVVTWRPGQASALDKARIAEGRDVGTVVVRRRTAAGLKDIPYDVTFAFVFRAFRPQGVLHTLDGAVRFGAG